MCRSDLIDCVRQSGSTPLTGESSNGQRVPRSCRSGTVDERPRPGVPGYPCDNSWTAGQNSGLSRIWKLAIVIGLGVTAAGCGGVTGATSNAPASSTTTTICSKEPGTQATNVGMVVVRQRGTNGGGYIGKPLRLPGGRGR